ncbi:dual specificity protein phosphatase family protein [Gemmata sp.]|uniref:dual specificity protein phosphatase family protein n=1 Tax=Gemmata sp. TaxID=1914242 RepID=UPI003F72C51E
MAFDFDTLEVGLALSGTPQAAREILSVGFEAVVNIWDTNHPPYLAGLPPLIKVLQQPIEDGIPAPVAFLRRAALELAHFQRRNLWTLVHCQQGQSRSATLVALYWMGRDGVSWDDAVARMRAVRPQVQPHPKLVDGPTRDAVVQSVRRYLAGDEAELRRARMEAEDLRLADEDRGPPHAAKTWSLIETGLGCGSAPLQPAELDRTGFTRLLNVAGGEISGFGMRLPEEVEAVELALAETSPVRSDVLAEAVWYVRAWRQAGHEVFVSCTDGKSRSVLVVALALMLDRDWDFAGAMWYIRKRRPGAWPRPQILEKRPVPDLLAACREFKPDVESFV